MIWTFCYSSSKESDNKEGQIICDILDRLVPKNTKYSGQIAYVQDRPGHDRRYSIDSSKIQRELGWKPLESFDTGIMKTVQWYLDNLAWCQNVECESYQRNR